MATPITGWDGETIGYTVQSWENPQIGVYGYYGRNPETTVECRDCAHLVREMPHNKTYRKCDLRTLTRGPGSDHKASWPACGKYKREVAACGGYAQPAVDAVESEKTL